MLDQWIFSYRELGPELSWFTGPNQVFLLAYCDEVEMILTFNRLQGESKKLQ